MSNANKKPKSYPHTCGFTAFQWEFAQRESGLENAAPYIRSLFDQWMYDKMSKMSKTPPVAVVPSPEPVEPDLTERWAEVGADGWEWDKSYRKARAWFIQSHGSELKALEWVEKGVRERGMYNPRGVIVQLWIDAGRPEVPAQNTGS